MKRRALTEVGAGGARSFRDDVSRAIESIQDADRLRLLEPTSLPKVLRGRPPYRQPNTAILSRIALERFKARMWSQGIELTDDEAERIFRGQ
jgi:hypothetical protein